MLKQTKQFHFKQFSILTGSAGMAVSTDGVLLGAWADLNRSQHILDIGTGTGLLALMCAQRQPIATICALDIDATAVTVATENAAQSPWSSRIQVQQADILSYAATTPFDTIICNPPYFNQGASSPNQLRALARHTIHLPHQNLLDACKVQLSDNGAANFILPLIEGEQFIDYATNHGWYLSRLCSIRTTKSKPVSRLLIELTLAASHCVTQQMTIKDNHHHYSRKFIKLTHHFYPKMPS